MTLLALVVIILPLGLLAGSMVSGVEQIVAIPVVIFLGAIGGFLVSGIIGLFVGAVMLTLGYKFFQLWLKEEGALPEINKGA